MEEWISVLIPGAILGVVAFQLGYMFFFFTAFPAVSREEPEAKTVPVSLVVCARNELKNLQDHLPLWLKQDHPEFELIVVNDRSWDTSEAFLDEEAAKDKRLRAIHLHDHDRDLVGKKFALTIGIKAAKNERVVLTDADCRPADASWLRRMTDRGDRPFFVLGYGAVQGRGFSGMLSEFETQTGAMHWMSWSNRGQAYMGVGRNLSYTRSMFLGQNNFSQYMHIPGGDDDLFIQNALSAYKARVLLHPNAFTFSPAKSGVVQWKQQLRRHMSTAAFYPFLPKFLLGLWGATSILYWLAVCVLPFFSFLWSPMILGVLSARFVFFQLFMQIGSFRLGKWWMALLTPILEPLLLLLQMWAHAENRINGIKKSW
jgi:glycosyltransferase involved in cell wall biosynthesis